MHCHHSHSAKTRRYTKYCPVTIVRAHICNTSQALLTLVGARAESQPYLAGRVLDTRYERWRKVAGITTEIGAKVSHQLVLRLGQR